MAAMETPVGQHTHVPRVAGCRGGQHPRRPLRPHPNRTPTLYSCERLRSNTCATSSSLGPWPSSTTRPSSSIANTQGVRLTRARDRSSPVPKVDGHRLDGPVARPRVRSGLRHGPARHREDTMVGRCRFEPVRPHRSNLTRAGPYSTATTQKGIVFSSQVLCARIGGRRRRLGNHVDRAPLPETAPGSRTCNVTPEHQPGAPHRREWTRGPTTPTRTVPQATRAPVEATRPHRQAESSTLLPRFPRASEGVPVSTRGSATHGDFALDRSGPHLGCPESPPTAPCGLQP